MPNIKGSNMCVSRLETLLWTVKAADVDPTTAADVASNPLLNLAKSGTNTNPDTPEPQPPEPETP